MSDHSAEVSGRTWRKWSTDVEVYITDPERVDAAAELLAGYLDQLDAAINRFRADSEIRALPTAVSPLFARHLEAALDAARETDGLLDPTVGGRLVELGYDADIEQVKVHAVERPHTPRPRWQSIVLEGNSLSVAAGTVLDLGSTSKALAADDGARMIAEQLGCGALVALGGDVATAGNAPDQGWVVGVAGGSCSIVLAEGCGIATSSTLARRWQTAAGQRHHLIDPRTGLPAESPWVTVTVAAPDCLRANVASTASIILGDPAPSWLEDRGLPARLVGADGQVVVTSGWPRSEVAA